MISINSAMNLSEHYKLSCNALLRNFALFRIHHFCRYDVVYVDIILQLFQQNMLGWPWID